MDITAAMRAVAPAAPRDAADALAACRDRLSATGVLDNPPRLAHLIGQCAHESMRFTVRAENLHYRSTARIRAVFGARRFPGDAAAAPFVRNPQALANRVYGGRMGNGPPATGDGFRYRGRGWLQLTGRANYRRFGQLIGVDLEARPARAADPGIAWLVAATYLATRRRAGRTALQWADLDNVEMVTRIVNGGANGLAERRHLTALALAALGGDTAHPALRRGSAGPAVLRLQHLLAAAGFTPGALDGDFGPRTEAALGAFQAAVGVPVTGVAGQATWAMLDP